MKRKDLIYLLIPVFVLSISAFTLYFEFGNPTYIFATISLPIIYICFACISTLVRLSKNKSNSSHKLAKTTLIFLPTSLLFFVIACIINNVKSALFVLCMIISALLFVGAICCGMLMINYKKVFSCIGQFFVCIGKAIAKFFKFLFNIRKIIAVCSPIVAIATCVAHIMMENNNKIWIYDWYDPVFAACVIVLCVACFGVLLSIIFGIYCLCKSIISKTKAQKNQTKNEEQTK